MPRIIETSLVVADTVELVAVLDRLSGPTKSFRLEAGDDTRTFGTFAAGSMGERGLRFVGTWTLPIPRDVADLMADGWTREAATQAVSERSDHVNVY